MASEINTSYMSKNVITDNLDIGDEKVIDQNHLYNVVASRIMDCNPHTKVKYRMEAISKRIDSEYVIFVPSSATQSIVIPKTERKILIDIRSLDMKGKLVLHVFENLLSDFTVAAESAMGKKGKIYMTPTSITNKKTVERPKCPLAGKSVTVLVDRYSLAELDEYCAMVLAYFYSHYKVKGSPHKMYKYVFKDIRIGQHKKYEFAIPVLKLLY